MQVEDDLLSEKLAEFLDDFLGSTHVRTVARRVHHHELAVRKPFVNIFSHARARNDISLALQHQGIRRYFGKISAIVGENIYSREVIRQKRIHPAEAGFQFSG